jgi:antitoxin (DNA-binding transcriptional repressor) of toxin-antitoxin stability system
MKVVGVKELKARLSEYLRMARAGETVLVTDRGEAIAELGPTRRRGAAVDDVDRVLDALAEAGEISRAAMAKGNWTFRTKGLGLPAGTARALLDEIRGERTMA